MWLTCYTEDEIAKSEKVSIDIISKWIIQKKQEIGKMVIFPESHNCNFLQKIKKQQKNYILMVHIVKAYL
jgi:hypothetical protein